MLNQSGPPMVFAMVLTKQSQHVFSINFTTFHLLVYSSVLIAEMSPESLAKHVTHLEVPTKYQYLSLIQISIN